MKFPAFEPINLKNDISTFEVVELELSKIIPDPNQPRKIFDHDALNDLAASIKDHGVIQPIIVIKMNDDLYQLIAGERRWRASKLVGKSVIPAIVKGKDERQNIAISLIENIQRENLNPIELAESFSRLVIEHDLSHEEIAKMVGKSRPTVSNLLRLLDLPLMIRNRLIEGRIEMGHARALLGLAENRQEEVSNIIINKALTVRQTETLIKELKKKKERNKIHNISQSDNNILSSLKLLLIRKLNTKVNVSLTTGGQGRIILDFDNIDSLNEFVEKISLRD